MHSWRPHELIDAKARPQFLVRQPDQAVFAAMKAVEVRVRQLAGLGDELYGVKLMNNAFGPRGALADPPSPSGEHNDGPRALFAGAMAMFTAAARRMDCWR